jgi:hypothetical protein
VQVPCSLHMECTIAEGDNPLEKDNSNAKEPPSMGGGGGGRLHQLSHTHPMLHCSDPMVVVLIIVGGGVVVGIGVGIGSGGAKAVVGIFVYPLFIVILLLIIARRVSAMIMAALMRQGTVVGCGRGQ